jgi:putative hemolysin
MKYIDIAKQIKSRDSKLLNNLPVFIVKLIERIIKQDGLNQIINDCAEFDGPEFLVKALEHENIKLEIEGMENLPESGKCFFVANHPFGFVDSMGLNAIIGSHYGEIKSIGNELFNFIPNLRSLILNVNVFGKNSRNTIIELNKLYASDVPITHFPYGLVSRIHENKVQDKIWKKSFIKKAVTNQRDIVPIRFYGRNSNLFYSIYRIRKFFGIKANLELMLLPREMFRKNGKTIKVKIYPVISYKTLDKSKSHEEWAEEIRTLVYKS